MAPAPISNPDPLTFDSFWKWLLNHRNCLVRVSAGDITVSDNELLHWDLFDEEGRAICHLVQGKTLVAEVVIDRSEILFVQSTADIEDPQSGHWLFECIGGNREDSYPMYAFVMTHGMDQQQGHQLLKH